jgi:hypothetical protein
MFRLFIILLISVCGEIGALDQEVGAYSRKSVSYVDALWLLDNSSRSLSSKQIKKTIASIHKELKLGRFDYNPIPDSYLDDFVNAANSVELGGGASALEKLSKLMEAHLVPKIAEALEVNKELRAAKRLTEQQRNSFITDKAKLLGVTENELLSVMNSAFIYLPVVKGYSQFNTGGDYYNSIELGVVWFKLEFINGELKAEPIIKEWSSTTTKSTPGEHYLGYGNYKDYAFGKLVEQGAKNLRVATQNHKDFKLTGQIMEADKGSVGFDIGPNEGAKINNAYLLIEKFQNENGDIAEEEAGWVLLDGFQKDNELIPSTGYIVSGKPDIGVELREYPLMPLEIGFGGLYTPVTINDEEITLNSSNGIDLFMLYQLGTMFQNFVEVGITGGVLDIDENIDGLNGSIRLGWSKRLMMYRRLALRTSVGIIFQHVYLNSKLVEYADSEIYNNNFGLYINGNVEFALSPKWKIGFKSGMNFMSENDNWTDKSDLDRKYESLDWSNLSLGMYFSFNPKSLIVDPVDWIRGNIRSR